MERLESLGQSLSQITLYDIKSMYNQAKNVVLNVTEMEAKVREATNEDPWGASSTLMQDIAQGTFNFQHFNEIMPSIYARFMEKEARQWRQIYKALQLLEYLIKHGSERVVDDARSHISTLKMLRNFHYIDGKGKDEGLNVRNRSRELVELLSDVEKIRTERRKAKANKHKYIGTGNDGVSFNSGGRYGGFGSDTLQGGEWSGGNGSYGSGGSYDREYGSNYSGGGFKDDTRRGGFEEYNAGDDEVPVRRSTSLRSPTRSSTAPPSSTGRQNPKAKEEAPAPAPAPEANLLDLLDDDAFGGSGGMLGTNKALPAVNPAPTDVDDEFADFQAAPAAQNAKPTNLMDMLNPTASRPAPAQPLYTTQPTMQAQSSMFGASNGFGMSSNTPAIAPTQKFFGATSLQPASINPSTVPPRHVSQLSTTHAAVKPNANFDDLWSMSLGSSTVRPASAGAGGSKSIKDLEKEKALAGLWGKSGPGANTSPFGVPTSMGGASSSMSNSTGGADDLLL